MTNGQASDINVLLDWLLDMPTIVPRTPEEWDAAAKESAKRLADAAHKKLMAGITAADVEGAWRS